MHLLPKEVSSDDPNLHHSRNARMSVGEFIVQFWLSATILSVIVSLSVFPIVSILHSKTLGCPQTLTEEQRGRIRWLEIGTAVAVVLCWVGALLAAADSPLWVDR